MRLNGHELRQRIREARAQPASPEQAEALAQLLMWEELYAVSVHARFTFPSGVAQRSLSEARHARRLFGRLGLNIRQLSAEIRAAETVPLTLTP